MINPADSRDDSFIVKISASGQCEWQISWGTDSDVDGEQTSHYAQDIALTPGGDIVMVEQQYIWPGQLSGNASATSSLVREVAEDNNGDPQEIWRDHLGFYEGYDIEITSVGVDDDDNVVVGGHHNHGFWFDSNYIPDPSSTEEFEAFVLSYGPLSNRTRSQNHSQSWGGDGWNFVNDVAVDSAGTVAVVGDYLDQHTTLDGVSGPSANNTNLFIETLDSNLNPIDSLTGSGSTTYSYDSESATAAAFDPSGDLYVTGWFKGELKKQPNGGIGPDNPLVNALETDSTEPQDMDWFIVSYTDAASDLTDVDIWEQSGLTEPGDAVTIERPHDIAVNEYLVAIGGTAKCLENSNDLPNCERTGFVYSELMNDVASGDPLSQYTLNFGYGSQARSADAIGLGRGSNYDTLAVGGNIAGTNVNLGGSPLPGPYSFIAGYQF